MKRRIRVVRKNARLLRRAGALSDLTELASEQAKQLEEAGLSIQAWSDAARVYHRNCDVTTQRLMRAEELYQDLVQRVRENIPLLLEEHEYAVKNLTLLKSEKDSPF